MTVVAPYENKMYEAIITELDTSAGTAKVKFANYSTIETVLISQLGEFTGKRTERGRWVNNFTFSEPLYKLWKLKIQKDFVSKVYRIIFSRWASQDPMARAPLPSTVMDNDVGINSKAAREKVKTDF